MTPKYPSSAQVPFFKIHVISGLDLKKKKKMKDSNCEFIQVQLLFFLEESFSNCFQQFIQNHQ